MRYCLLIFFLVFCFPVLAVVSMDQLIIDYPTAEYELDQSEKSELSLVSDLNQIYVPSRYIVEALNTISGIVFKKMPEDVAAYYNQLNKKIYFSLDMQDGSTRNLKRIKDMTLDQFATLVHEFWHAYFYNVAKVKRNLLYQNWLKGANAIYPDHGLKYHDEAYALYVDQVLQMYLLIRRTFEDKTPEIRERLRQSKPLSGMYEGVFNEKIFGYYVNTFRQVIYTDVNLPEVDRNNILNYLFDNNLKKNYLEAYSENRF